MFLTDMSDRLLLLLSYSMFYCIDGMDQRLLIIVILS
jgi:hypothetical protein